MASLHARRTTIGILVLLVLAACGGGGQSGPVNPVISGSPPAGATGVAYAGYTFTVASGGAGPFTWSETGTLPPGLSFSATGQLSGTPQMAGTYPVTIMVSDSSVPALRGILQVSLGIADSPITIGAAPAPPDGTTTNAYPGFLFGVSTGGSPPFAWGVTAGNLPPGLSLAGDGSLTGTPTSAGAYLFTVTATDSASPASTGSQAFTVTITDPGPPLISPSPVPPAATVGLPYQFQFAASGGSLPLSWTVTGGALPPGLALGTDGSVTGTPTTVGSSTFTVTVTDSAPTPRTNAAPFTIATGNPPAPTINSAPSPPAATVGVAYPGFAFSAKDGLAPLVWSETGSLPGLGIGLDGVLSGTASSAGQFPIMVDVRDALNRSAPGVPFTIRVSLARPAAAFTGTGSLSIARRAHTATLLPSGKVLITGGADASGQGLASAELYDPSSGLFSATGSMMVAHTGHTATLLADAALPDYGKVLIAGGDLGGTDAELYDPASGTFTTTGTLAAARILAPTATLLGSGKVLIAGGDTSTAELYDPASGTFSATGSMTALRGGHTATLLSDGRVLVTGGGGSGGGKSATAELYDPVTGMFLVTGNMAIARTRHTATLLQNGTVLIVGTDDPYAEVYDPATGSFTAVGSLSPYGGSPLVEAYAHTASLRADGTVLIAGGFDYVVGRVVNFAGLCVYVTLPGSLAATALFAPESGGFTATGLLNTARDGHSATVLGDDTILVVGGEKRTTFSNGFCHSTGVSQVLSSAELFK